MATHPILYQDQWMPAEGQDAFTPENPATGEPLGQAYPVSTLADLTRLAKAARRAAHELNHAPPEHIARFLRFYADNIDAHREAIARMAHLETGLAYEPRLLQTEMDRTVDQLRQGADAVEDGSWVQASIESDLNLRSMYEPLGGGVVVMGPNNFPLAYNGIAGGDFTAAIAARNPVIAKAHTLHPGTTRLLAEQALAASKAARLPAGSVQMFYHCAPEDGLALIRMPEITGVGFTGSRRAGLSLKQAADETGTPIYLELSSINPIFILPGACAVRGDGIADAIGDSILAASGQQCTSPGLLMLVGNDDAARFIERLRRKLAGAQAQVMLSTGGVRGLADSVQQVRDAGAETLLGGGPLPGPGARFEHTLLRVGAKAFLSDPGAFQTEMFGVAALIVLCEDPAQFDRIAQSLEGNLTGSIYAQHEGQDAPAASRLTRHLRPRVGRLLNDHVPTGVAVRPSMVHGGPFPATGHPGFTAVGIPTALPRFAARRCYDRVHPAHLPPELRDPNPTGSMARRINGRWTTQGVV